MVDKIYSIKLALKNLNLNKKLAQIVHSDGSFELLQLNDSRRPDLLIFELAENAKKEMDLIQTLLEADEVGEVFLTSDVAEPAALMQAIRLGVKEFFSQPIKIEEVKQALQKFKVRRKAPVDTTACKLGHVINVFGSKGGVGTTTVAVNLAISLSQKAGVQSVALLDMNTLFGEIPLFLEMVPKFHWGEITKNVERLDDTFLENVMMKHSTGIQILPSPANLNGHHKPTPEIMSRLLGLMKRMFDYVVIDAGQSTDTTSLKVLELSDTLFLVTILSLPCLANTNKLVKSFIDFGYVAEDQIKIVLNRYLKKSEVSLHDAESGIGKKIFWIIPNDFVSTMSAINKGKPLLQIAPKAPITKNFSDLANTLIPQQEKPNKKGWNIFKR
jgi:pilus assembly protein CpaE